MRVAFFTAGSTGAGHFVRGEAIRRAIERRGAHCRFRSFGPGLPFPRAHQDGYEAVCIDPAELCSEDRAADSEVARALRAYGPDLIICDLFWAPLRYVLPVLRCEAWLLVRCCPDNWFARQRGLVFQESQYTRVIAIEPRGAPVARESIDPIVICNADEQQPLGALREYLAVPRDERLVVAMHAGESGEIDQLSANATRTFDLRDRAALFPLAPWLSGADEIYCGAGYNTFWESRWLGYSGRCRYTAFPRRIDDQAWRLRTLRGYAPTRNGADVLAAAIA